MRLEALIPPSFKRISLGRRAMHFQELKSAHPGPVVVGGDFNLKRRVGV